MTVTTIDAKRPQLYLCGHRRFTNLRILDEHPNWPDTPLGQLHAVRYLKDLYAEIPAPADIHYYTILDEDGCEVAYREISRRGKSDVFCIRQASLKVILPLVEDPDEIAAFINSDLLDGRSDE